MSTNRRANNGSPEVRGGEVGLRGGMKEGGCVCMFAMWYLRAERFCPVSFGRLLGPIAVPRSEESSSVGWPRLNLKTVPWLAKNKPNPPVFSCRCPVPPKCGTEQSQRTVRRTAHKHYPPFDFCTKFNSHALTRWLLSKSHSENRQNQNNK